MNEGIESPRTVGEAVDEFDDDGIERRHDSPSPSASC
jgi:hypothetical protein